VTGRAMNLSGASRRQRRLSIDPSPLPSRRLRVVGAVAAGSIMWLVVGGIAGVAAAVLITPVAARLLRRVEPPSARRARQAAASELPFAADLLAAALRAGVPVEAAARTTGAGIGGAVGRDLVRVADGLRLGLEPADAWPVLRGTPGADRIVDTVVRSADSGAAVARALERLADDLRGSRAVAVEAAAARVGVLIVLPLGLCFLPAFVLAGIVPVIVAVLGGVLR
jgi:Flp pilus assembly protein TadB